MKDVTSTCPRPIVLRPMPYFQCPMSNVQCPMSNVQCPRSKDQSTGSRVSCSQQQSVAVSSRSKLQPAGVSSSQHLFNQRILQLLELVLETGVPKRGGGGSDIWEKFSKNPFFGGVRAASLRIFEFQICADIVQGTAAATLGLKTFDVLSDKLSPCNFFESKTWTLR